MYRGLKSSFLDYYGVTDATMHLVLGLAFYATAYAVTRKPWLCLWLLIGLQLGNEAVDIREQLNRGWVDYHQSITDSAWTLALPFASAYVLAGVHAVWRVLQRGPSA